jgi:hypothetical protein
MYIVGATNGCHTVSPNWPITENTTSAAHTTPRSRVGMTRTRPRTMGATARFSSRAQNSTGNAPNIPAAVQRKQSS